MLYNFFYLLTTALLKVHFVFKKTTRLWTYRAKKTILTYRKQLVLYRTCRRDPRFSGGTLSRTPPDEFRRILSYCLRLLSTPYSSLMEPGQKSCPWRSSVRIRRIPLPLQCGNRPNRNSEDPALVLIGRWGEISIRFRFDLKHGETTREREQRWGTRVEQAVSMAGWSDVVEQNDWIEWLRSQWDHNNTVHTIVHIMYIHNICGKIDWMSHLWDGASILSKYQLLIGIYLKHQLTISILVLSLPLLQYTVGYFER